MWPNNKTKKMKKKLWWLPPPTSVDTSQINIQFVKESKDQKDI